MGTFQAFYTSELQGIWALLPVPFLFLVYLGLRGRDRARASGRPEAAFLVAWSAVFGALTLVDPLSTGAFGRWLDVPDLVSSAVMFLFVWIGDFRVFALVFPLAGVDKPWLRAVVWTFLVPALDLALFFGALKALWPEVPGQVLWLIHEVAFLALALALRSRLPEGPHRAFLRGALAYVAAYYALWASADVLILAGLDAGWALRVVPNQLYYAFWVPFVFFTFLRR
ncbi:MAG: hypothetical protein QNK04_28455 [Myxococcota bacterium]|nr:hypothetical protein [Myxococcota bacterium]